MLFGSSKYLFYDRANSRFLTNIPAATSVPIAPLIAAMKLDPVLARLPDVVVGAVDAPRTKTGSTMVLLDVPSASLAVPSATEKLMMVWMAPLTVCSSNVTAEVMSLRLPSDWVFMICKAELEYCLPRSMRTVAEPPAVGQLEVKVNDVRSLVLSIVLGVDVVAPEVLIELQLPVKLTVVVTPSLLVTSNDVVGAGGGVLLLSTVTVTDAVPIFPAASYAFALRV